MASTFKMKLQKVKMTPKPLNKIEDFCLKLFDLIGADENVASACVASVMHGTRFGVDSHGLFDYSQHKGVSHLCATFGGF